MVQGSSLGRMSVPGDGGEVPSRGAVLTIAELYSYNGEFCYVYVTTTVKKERRKEAITHSISSRCQGSHQPRGPGELCA